MLCNYKKVIESSKKEFLELLTTTYDNTAVFYPYDADEENKSFYFSNNQTNKNVNKEEVVNLYLYMLYKCVTSGLFVCDLEQMTNDGLIYYTIIVK